MFFDQKSSVDNVQNKGFPVQHGKADREKVQRKLSKEKDKCKGQYFV